MKAPSSRSADALAGKNAGARLRLLGTAVGLTAPLWIISVSSAQTPYTLTDLGILGGIYDSSIAYGINDAGVVVGQSYQGSSNGQVGHAFQYSGNGPMVDLNPVFGGTNSMASAINASGTIVGWADSAGVVLAGGPPTYLNPTTGGNPFSPPSGSYNGSFLAAINSSGQAAGEAYGPGGYEAILYSGGTTTDLGNLGGSSEAQGINNAGKVVGWSWIPGGGQHAFVYDGTIHDIGTIAGSDNVYSYASAINNHDQITGGSDAPGGAYDAFLYDGTMHDLGTLGGDYSVGDAINDLGQIVGESYTAGDASYDAFLYSDGVMTDLNTLIPAGSDLTLAEAYGINDYGDIVGYGINSLGNWEAFELTPTPEPASLSLLAIGAAGLLLRRRNTRKI